MEWFIIISFMVLFSCNNWIIDAARVIEPLAYIERITKRVVEITESRIISGSDLPIDDYTAPINISAYGIRLEGNVSFHSAFVAKIGGMELNTRKFKEILLNTEAAVEASILWHHIGVVLDFSANLQEYQGTGTFLVTYQQFEFPLRVSQMFETGQVSGSLRFMTIDSQNNIVVVGYPNNAYVQMIGKTIKSNYYFRNYMIASFERWNFQNILDVALKENPFPGVCYDC
ncbi:uncharacterized protein LOC129780089 [Toxorhynchites rutilus septentrionalis]|uniref:uncharacterized protein LOC129780089 n=1 Tax=Toxorhynchites rutilus septentrionalis TaxID=329112 RepID=UPI0024793704|nr:uncharacterized protein LOC129780089 [Toxorhynchites rutilus septentrionalis]